MKTHVVKNVQMRSLMKDFLMKNFVKHKKNLCERSSQGGSVLAKISSLMKFEQRKLSSSSF